MVLGLAPGALAQSWVPARTTPSLVELGSVDRTGEPNWLYGAEDVAGDGLDTFTAAEQAIDLRTTYAVANNNELWVRSYVSSTAAPGDDVHLFVFVDADRNPNTGGSAIAPESRAAAAAHEGSWWPPLLVVDGGQAAEPAASFRLRFHWYVPC